MRCPECGTPIDHRADAAKRKYIARATTAPSRFNLLCWVVLLTFFVISGSPRGELTVALAVVIIFLTTLCTWFVPLIRTLLARRWLSSRGVSGLPLSSRWLALPVMLVLAYFAWTSRAVIHAQWFLSRGAFERQWAAPAPPQAPCWIGLYRVTHITNVTLGHTQFHVDPIFGIFAASSITIEGKVPTPSGSPFDENLGNNWWMLWDPS